MRFKNREISIFSLSTLDVIFGALGAFMILMLAAMSEYNPGAVDREVAENQQELVFVLLEWSEAVDIDLWVESRGRLNGPKPGRFPEANQESEWRDDQGDGGWGREDQAFVNAEGSYRVFYSLADPGTVSRTITARGWLIANGSGGRYSTLFLGYVPLALDRVGELVEVATFDIDDTGALGEWDLVW